LNNKQKIEHKSNLNVKKDEDDKEKKDKQEPVDTKYFKPWLKTISIPKYNNNLNRNLNNTLKLTDSHIEWHRMKLRMRDDLFMLLKFLQNSNATEWVLKCLHIEDFDPSKLRKDISASRLNVFEIMTMQSKL